MAHVYIKGYVGNLGTKVLIENKYDELSKYFNAEFLKKVLNDISGGVNPPLFMSNEELLKKDIIDKVIDSEEVSRGGLLTALWKICDRNKCGLRYTLTKVPIMQGTIEISNYFDINPYHLLTSETQVLFINEENDEMNKNVASNFYGNLFGETTNDKKRVRIDNDIESFLTKDYKDEIDKILPGFIKNYEKHSNSQK